MPKLHIDKTCKMSCSFNLFKGKIENHGTSIPSASSDGLKTKTSGPRNSVMPTFAFARDDFRWAMI